ncbi:MAG: hypothetical protein L6Q76_37745, partial [Polyangiaceae bacterium]|nr:hypothetical protein [Polyangiaceae bacterium]
MHRRDLVSLAVLAFAALTLGVGCPEEQKTSTSQGASTAKTGAGTTSAAPKPTAAATAAAAATMGTATIKGVVNFTGKAPEMKVPAKRKDAEFCKGKEVKYNAVIAEGGK